jgi:uncharacterized protein YegJ (DUF2314 family)
MKALIAIFALLLSSAAFAEKAEDRTVLVEGEDREMLAAIGKARSSLDAFLKLHANPPKGASDFKLKVGIQHAHGTEHMWVIPFKRTETGFSGILANEPDYVTGVHAGQEILFKREEISDWGYEQDGKQKGSFTVCVMFKHMTKAEADAYRRDYGFEC